MRYTATDLVLTSTEMLRKHGVVGKFVEYFGPGLQDLPLADRATIANMSPEYGATCGDFPDRRAIRQRQILQARAEILHKLSNHSVLTQHFSNREYEIRRGSAFAQPPVSFTPTTSGISIETG